MGLDEVAAELYGLAPEEFTAARDRQATELRRAGDRGLADAVRRLPRPTTAAWAVNQLVRRHPQEVEQLLTLGAQLREAQEGLDRQQLRELNRQQHRVVAAVRRQAEGVATELGRPLSEAVSRQVQGTLRAAMADADAADAVRSGLLTTDLESTGLAPVDVSGAVAVDGAAPVRGSGSAPPREPRAREQRTGADDPRDQRARAEDRARADDAREQEQARAEEESRRRAEEERRRAEEEERRRERARRETEEAERDAAAAAATLEDAEVRVGEVADRRAALAEEVEAVSARLQALQEEQDAVTRDEREARSARDAAARAAETAGRRASRARARLDRLA